MTLSVLCSCTPSSLLKQVNHVFGNGFSSGSHRHICRFFDPQIGLFYGGVVPYDSPGFHPEFLTRGVNASNSNSPTLVRFTDTGGD